MTIDDRESDPRRQRGRAPGEPAPGRGSGIDGVEIDAMLDRIDSVLRGDALDGAELPVSEAESGASVVTVELLADLAEKLAHIRAHCDSIGDGVVSRFAAEARTRIEHILRRREREATGTSPDPIEVEVDFEGLHDFMLDPDVDRVAG